MKIIFELEADSLEDIKEKISDFYYCWPPSSYGTFIKEPYQKDGKWFVEGSRGRSSE